MASICSGLWQSGTTTDNSRAYHWVITAYLMTVTPRPGDMYNLDTAFQWKPSSEYLMYKDEWPWP